MRAHQIDLNDLLQFAHIKGAVQISAKLVPGIYAGSFVYEYTIDDTYGNPIELPINKSTQRPNTVTAANQALEQLTRKLVDDTTDAMLAKLEEDPETEKQTAFHQSIRRIYSAVNLLSREETQALLSHALYQYELKE